MTFQHNNAALQVESQAAKGAARHALHCLNRGSAVHARVRVKHGFRSVFGATEHSYPSLYFLVRGTFGVRHRWSGAAQVGKEKTAPVGQKYPIIDFFLSCHPCECPFLSSRV